MSPSPRAMRRALSQALLIGGMLLAGCGRHTEESAMTDLENIHVTYKSSVHVLGVAEAKELILGISSNGMGYLLDGKNPAAATSRSLSRATSPPSAPRSMPERPRSRAWAAWSPRR